MKRPIAVAGLLLAMMSSGAEATEATQFAQAQAATKSAPKAAPVATKSANTREKEPADFPFCTMDGRRVEDKTTWCVKKQLQRCDARSGKWNSTGSAC